MLFEMLHPIYTSAIYRKNIYHLNITYVMHLGQVTWLSGANLAIICLVSYEIWFIVDLVLKGILFHMRDPYRLRTRSP